MSDQRELMLRIRNLNNKLNHINTNGAKNAVRKRRAIYFLLKGHSKKLRDIKRSLYNKEQWIMGKRIRYKKIGDSEYINLTEITTEHGLVDVTFDVELLSAEIHLQGTEIVLESFIAKSEHALKKEIKQRLISFGATFESESRERKQEAV